MDIYLSDDLSILHIGDFDLPIGHMPQWQRQTLAEAINKESDAAERDADTLAAARADEAETDARAATLADVRDIFEKHINLLESALEALNDH